MFERFTDKGRKIIILAREEAERHQNDYLGTEHLVLAILRESDGIALMILKKMGLSTEQIRLRNRAQPAGRRHDDDLRRDPFQPPRQKSDRVRGRRGAVARSQSYRQRTSSAWVCCVKKKGSVERSFAASAPTF